MPFPTFARAAPPAPASMEGARAAGWRAATFAAPGGVTARGVVRDGVGNPGVHLAIGCDEQTADGDDAWHGVVVRYEAGSAPAKLRAGTANVRVSFYGRAPVTAKWTATRDATGTTLLFPPASGEALLANLRREEVERGRPSVRLEIAPAGSGSPAAGASHVVFALKGLGEALEALAERCAAFAGPPPRHRERGW